MRAPKALLPFAPSLVRRRHLISEGLVWFFNPNKRSVRSRKCSCFSFVIPPIGIDRVLQHGERDPVGNGKAPPNSALFSRRNTALVEVTDSDRDADDNRSILFLAGSTSFDPKAMISHMFIPDLNACREPLPCRCFLRKPDSDASLSFSHIPRPERFLAALPLGFALALHFGPTSWNRFLLTGAQPPVSQGLRTKTLSASNLGHPPMAIILIAVVLAVITGLNYFGKPISRTMWLVLLFLSSVALVLILLTYLHF